LRAPSIGSVVMREPSKRTSSRREEVLLRAWFEDLSLAGTEKARHLAEKVLATGLEPYRQPPVMSPIHLDDIELVCWMALSPTQ
jgi:hypothetical protein